MSAKSPSQDAIRIRLFDDMRQNIWRLVSRDAICELALNEKEKENPYQVSLRCLLVEISPLNTALLFRPEPGIKQCKFIVLTFESDKLGYAYCKKTSFIICEGGEIFTEMHLDEEERERKKTMLDDGV